jgi:hypothetical protein
MTTQLAVGSTADERTADTIAQVVASLPISLRHATDEPELVGIAGSAGWSARARDAIDAGARGIVVVDPVDDDAAGVLASAGSAGVPVVIDGTWTHNPAVGHAAPAFRDADDEKALLEVRCDVPTDAALNRVLLGQLALVRELASAVTGLVVIRWDQQGYDVLATLASGSRAALTAIVTDALPHAAHVRSLKATTAVELTVPSPETATAGEAVVSGPDGATLLVTEYESAHRAAWRRLHRLVTASPNERNVDSDAGLRELRGFVHDCALAAAALDRFGG